MTSCPDKPEPAASVNELVPPPPPAAPLQFTPDNSSINTLQITRDRRRSWLQPAAAGTDGRCQRSALLEIAQPSDQKQCALRIEAGRAGFEAFVQTLPVQAKQTRQLRFASALPQMRLQCPHQCVPERRVRPGTQRQAAPWRAMPAPGFGGPGPSCRNGGLRGRSHQFFDQIEEKRRIAAHGLSERRHD